MIKIDIPLYNQEVYLLIEDTELIATKRINTEHDNLDKIDEDNNSRGFVWQTKYLKENEVEKSRFYIYVEKNDLTTTLEHELIHLCWDLLTNVGIKINPRNHEAMTYLFEYLLKECKEKIKMYS
jgi:hypothetical protein